MISNTMNVAKYLCGYEDSQARVFYVSAYLGQKRYSYTERVNHAMTMTKRQAALYMSAPVAGPVLPQLEQQSSETTKGRHGAPFLFTPPAVAPNRA